MNRKPIALVSGAAAIATAAIIATSGSAQSPTPSPTTLHLVEKSQKTVGFFPRHRPRQGDLLGFGETVSGDDTGRDRTVCTVIGKDQAVCTSVLRLSKGTITAQGVSGPKSTKRPIAITGGTGAYEGARGTALLTDTSARSNVLDITLLP